MFQKIVSSKADVGLICFCTFSGSQINKTRRKRWIKQKLSRSFAWRGSSTSTNARVISWVAVRLFQTSTSTVRMGVFSRVWIVFSRRSLPPPDCVLCPSGLRWNCQQNDEGWPGVALQSPWPQLRVHRVPRTEGHGHPGCRERAERNGSITRANLREVSQKRRLIFLRTICLYFWCLSAGYRMCVGGLWAKNGSFQKKSLIAKSWRALNTQW